MWFKRVLEAFMAIFSCRGLLPILIQIDRLGNAVSGGNPKTTISGRTGFYSLTRLNPYWKLMANIINFTFYPIDGKDHCYQAWKAEKNHNHNRGNDVGLALLLIFVLITCPIICVITYGSRLYKEVYNRCRKM